MAFVTLFTTLPMKKKTGAQDFIRLNFNPEHFSRKPSVSLQRKPWREHCAAPRGAMHCDIDIAVAGFLCPPSSVLNPVRWQPKYDPMQEKGTEVFFEIVEWLRWYGRLGIIVKLVILENVLGIFMRTRYNKNPPWYYFRKESKTVVTHVLLNVEKLSCHIVGVPMDRGRAIMIMVLQRSHWQINLTSGAERKGVRQFPAHQVQPHANARSGLFYWMQINTGFAPQDGTSGLVAIEVTTEGVGEDQEASR